MALLTAHPGFRKTSARTSFSLKTVLPDAVVVPSVCQVLDDRHGQVRPALRRGLGFGRRFLRLPSRLVRFQPLFRRHRRRVGRRGFRVGGLAAVFGFSFFGFRL
jgi:hypothetical protein